MGFLSRGLSTAALKDCGTQPVSREGLIISRRQVLSRGRVSLRSLVGMGSKRQVAGLEEIIAEVSC